VSTYRIVDIARKVVGVGSVGRARGSSCSRAATRLTRSSSRPRKRRPRYSRPARAERVPNHGERVVEGQQMMQSATDILLGWQRVHDLDGVERDFYVPPALGRQGVGRGRGDERQATSGSTGASAAGRSHARIARTSDRVAIGPISAAANASIRRSQRSPSVRRPERAGLSGPWSARSTTAVSTPGRGCSRRRRRRVPAATAMTSERVRSCGDVSLHRFESMPDDRDVRRDRCAPSSPRSTLAAPAPLAGRPIAVAKSSARTAPRASRLDRGTTPFLSLFRAAAGVRLGPGLRPAGPSIPAR